MRILLTNHCLHTIGGTETWTATMFQALKRMGHDVEVMTEMGPIPEPFVKSTGGKYDLALINHLNPNKINATKKIFTSHGVIPALEKKQPGADHYVGVSEEVCDFQGCDHVIRNPIDFTVYKSDRELNRFPRKVLIISKAPDIVTPLVKAALPESSVFTIGGSNKVPAKDYIANCDLVFSLGRGAYEALAMGRNVFVYDKRQGDGMITKESYLQYRQNNCSGRFRKMKFTPHQVRDEVLKYYSTETDFREVIRKEHESTNVVMKYLSL